jgi:ABC-type multidrug transport system ATPase subunit/ABC-type multidrug transport system permease subunit
VLLNAESITDANLGHISRIAKFVPERADLMGTLTVRETFAFSAELSLPTTMSAKAKMARVEDIVQKLGLEICIDTKIGTVFQKGISGGQLRRVSMGIELLTMPQLLIADTPTLGLDSASAKAIVLLLKQFAAEGNRNIVFSIDSPSSEVFEIFDRVLLLAPGGRQAYFGPASSIVGYFSSVGLQCPPFFNPAEFIVFKTSEKLDGAEEVGEEDEHVRPTDIDTLCKQWKRSPEQTALLATIERVRAQPSKELLVRKGGEEGAGVNLPGFGKQFYEVCKRMTMDNIRNPGVFWIRLVMYMMISVMIASVYRGIGSGQKEVVDRVGMLFYIAAFMIFMSIIAAPNMITDRLVMTRERLNRWYSVEIYCIAQVLCGLPGIFLIAVMSTCIVHPTVGLNTGPDGDRFALFMMSLFASLVAAEALVFLMSVIFPFYLLAMASVAGLSGLFMLVNGFFLLPANIPTFWKGFHYVGFHTYAFQLFIFGEFDSLEVDCDQPVVPSDPTSCRYNSGEDVLATYDLEDVDVVFCFLALLVSTVVFRGIAYLLFKVWRTGKL